MKRKPFAFATGTPVSGRAAAIRDGLLTRDLPREAYETGRNVSRYLDHIDPTESYPEGSVERGMDAFNRVLRACNIRTRSVPELGITASTLEEVVEHPQARYLATELFARAYRAAIFGGAKTRATVQSGEGIAGSFLAQYNFPPPRDILLQPAIPLTEVVGRTTGINGSYYKPFYLEDVSQATSRVSEGAEIPAVRISTSDKIVDLKKYGRRIDTTYEAMRRIPIDLLAFYVQRIAIDVEAEKVVKVLDVIINGDGNSGTAATSYNLTTLDSAAVVGTLTLRAWLRMRMKFKNPLILTTALGQEDPILQLMMLNSGSANIPLVQLGALGAAQGVTPINQGLRDGTRVGWMDEAPSNKIVVFDKRLSIERIFEIGSNIQESDKDVKSQIDSLVLSEVEGYAIIDPKANKILNLAA